MSLFFFAFTCLRISLHDKVFTQLFILRFILESISGFASSPNEQLLHYFLTLAARSHFSRNVFTHRPNFLDAEEPVANKVSLSQSLFPARSLNVNQASDGEPTPLQRLQQKHAQELLELQQACPHHRTSGLMPHFYMHGADGPDAIERCHDCGKEIQSIAHCHICGEVRNWSEIIAY